MSETVDSLSIELTASTGSAEASIQRVIDMLRMLKAATIDASIESKIGKSIRSIAQAAKEIDSDAGQKLARLAGGLRELSKVGDLSNLANAGKNLSGVVRAVNSMGHGGNGLSNLANGIRGVSDALGGIKDADVSKLNAVKDALSGEMSGSLHSSARTSESAALGGMGSPEPSFGNMAAYGAMTVFKYTADSIRDATAAYREFQAALGSGIPPIFTEFVNGAKEATRSVLLLGSAIRGLLTEGQNFSFGGAGDTFLKRRMAPLLNAGQDFTFGNNGVDKSAAIEIEDLGESASETADKLRDVANSTNDVSGKIHDATGDAVGIRFHDILGNDATPPDSWADADMRIRKTAEAFQEVGNACDDVSGKIHDATGDAVRFHDILGNDVTPPNSWADADMRIRKTAEAFQEAGNACDDVSGKIHDVAGNANRAAEETENVANSTRDATSASISFGDRLRLLFTTTEQFRKGIAGFGTALLSIPKYFGGQLVGNIEKAGKSVAGFFRQIKRVAMYRLIRTALKLITQNIGEGIKNLYHWSQTADHTFANSMNTIATASKYVGNSFAAMVSPLINAVAPAIDFIADKFVDLFNLINQVIARLSGKTSYTAAKKVAAQWEKASQSAQGSVNDLKRTILGFDEINKLNAPSSGSGGGGGSGTSGSNMFETLPIEGSVSSFADQLKAAFDESNWQEIGTLLGGKVNELVNNINFAGAGAKVGEGINGWFTTKYWTLDTINFTNIGSKIAEFLNNAIEKIDFNIIGRSMVQKLTIIGDLIIGFFTDFDWGQAATALSDFVKGLFDEFTKWFDSHNWGEIGGVLYQKLTDALANFDAEGIADSIFTALGTAVKSLIELGAGFLAWFWDDVSDWWENDIKADTFTETVHNILDAIGQGFSNIGEWVWNNIVNPFIVALTGNENWLEDFTKWGENVWNAIWNGVTSTVSNIAEFAIVLWDNIVNPFITALTGNENWLEDFIGWGKSIWDGICKGITDAISGVGTWIKNNIWKPFVDWFKSIFGIASPAKTMEEPGKNIILGVFKGIKDALKNVGQWVKENIFDPIWNAIASVGTTAITIAVSLVKKTGEWAADAWTALTDTAQKTVNRIVTLAKSAATWAADAWTAFTDTAQKTVNRIVTLAKSTTNWAADAWDFIQGPKNIVKDVIVNIIGKIDSWLAAFLGINTGSQRNQIIEEDGGATAYAIKYAKEHGIDVGVSLVKGNSGAQTAQDVYSIEDRRVTGRTQLAKANSGAQTAQDVYSLADRSVTGRAQLAKANSGAQSVSDVYSSAEKAVSGKVSLVKNGWTSIADFVGTSVRTVVNLSNSGSNWVNGVAQWITGNNKGETTVKVNLAAGSGGTWRMVPQALGGAFYGGSWHDIPQYASGTTNAHGSLFLAGEAGPEVVGHVGGRTEVLNKSQLASAMFSAVRSAMSGISIDASFYGGGNADGEMNGETLSEMMEYMRADSDEMRKQNELLRQQNELLRQIREKDYSPEISTSSINKAQTRANRRAGITIVPVGT